MGQVAEYNALREWYVLDEGSIDDTCDLLYVDIQEVSHVSGRKGLSLQCPFAEFGCGFERLEEESEDAELILTISVSAHMHTTHYEVGELVDAANEAIDSDDPGQFLKD